MFTQIDIKCFRVSAKNKSMHFAGSLALRLLVRRLYDPCIQMTGY